VDSVQELAADVVVVGSGAGALTGAYTAASAGLSTVVLEKTALFGGTSAYSGGGLFLPGNQAAARAGIVDSVDRGRTYLRALLGDHDLARREAFLTTAPDVIAFLERDPALRFEYYSFPDYFDADGRLPGGGHIVPAPLSSDCLPPGMLDRLRPTIAAERTGLNVPRDRLSGGQALIGRMLLALFGTRNAELRIAAAVHDLIVEDGAVVGVQADTNLGKLQVRARRGVLLAAGGFERDSALRAANGVPGSAEATMAPPGTNEGEPLQAAVAIGAATDLMDQAWWCPALVQPDGSAAFFLGLRGGIFVDVDGRRFADESWPYDRMGRELAADPARRIPCYYIFDSVEGGRLPAVNCVPGVRRDDYLASGAWVCANSIAELAGRLNLPGEALARTVARFNEFTATGVDEDFHRGEDEYDRYFAAPNGRPNPALVPLAIPPYFAARVVLGDLGTKGGLATDADARVVRDDGSPIPGLYAAGNTSASIMRDRYPAPGSPIATAMVFAYRAARHMSGPAAARSLSSR
jgi:succinate dehydrogenase/fumarate reductase flavoprotein subunit